MVYIQRHLSYVDDADHLQKTISEQELADWRAPVVILGEPGMGKSGLLRSLAYRQDRFELVTAMALKRRHVAFAEAKIVLIDGLDELPGAAEQDPIQDVLEKLAALGSPPFFLSCRANDWRSVAKQSIREDYGRDPTEFRLTALSSEEAVAFLAERHGPDSAQTFVDRMDRQGISEFYGNPLTLQLVDRLAATAEGLPRDRADLFSRASDALRQEQNQDRPRSSLTGLSKERALNAVGAACAALILTGSEAINLGAQGAAQEGDLNVSDVAELPGAADLRTMMSCMLFERRDGDRAAPFHRAMAEFLAAGWLASNAQTISVRRLLAMMSYQGGVPASLRGLHSWLAYFSPALRRAVIAGDPYAVLRYGDAAYLTPSDASLLLRQLEKLSEVDPWFASGDDRRHQAPALTQIGMADELRRVLLAPQSAFQLKSILLQALPHSEAAPALLPVLETIYMSPEPPAGAVDDSRATFTYHERSAASDVLVDLLPRESWSSRVQVLLNRAGEDDRRLAVESIKAVGSQHFEPVVIARAALAYAGLLPGEDGPRRPVESYGDIYLLASAMCDHQIAAVLDALVSLSPDVKEASWRAAREFSTFVNQLLEAAIGEGTATSQQLLQWLRLAPIRFGGEQEARQTISRFLLANHGLRRAIQRHVILQEAREKTSSDWLWTIFDIDPGLNFTEEDLVDLLAPTNFSDMADPLSREIWLWLVSRGATMRGLPPAVRSVAQITATGDAELEAFLINIDRKRIPKYLREDRIRRWRGQAKLRKRYEARRAAYMRLAAEIREGSWVGLSIPANVYLCRYSDVARDASPQTRLIDFVGDDLAQQMLVGFEASLHRTDLPPPSQIGESYAESTSWSSTAMLLAGGCERALAGCGFEDLAEDIVLSITLGEILEHVPDGLQDILRAALEQWFSHRPEAWERAWRLAIEPQLAAGREHVTGLYRFLRSDMHGALVAKLAVQWLDRFPNAPIVVELELLDALCRKADWPTLKGLMDSREAVGYRDAGHRLAWRAIAFFADFTAARAILESTAREEPNLFWSIHRRGWPSEESGRGRAIRLEQLVWLIRTFRSAFPATSRPLGSSLGDTNSWDATEFLHAMIGRVANDTSDDAVAALAGLRDEVVDGYLPFLKNACAQQLRARRDAGFVPLTLLQIGNVLRDQGPTSAADFQALVLDAIAQVQDRMSRDDVDQVSLFYETGAPKDEEPCRNALVILLRDLIGHGTDAIPEHLMPGGKRADIVFALNEYRLPVEAKGQWHRDLWSAANEQLDSFYAVEWRTGGFGIYLVFWFGSDAPPAKTLTSPGRATARPETPDALREALIARIPEHRRGQIAVVVLDVSRRAGASLVPPSSGAVHA